MAQVDRSNTAKRPTFLVVSVICVLATIVMLAVTLRAKAVERTRVEALNTDMAGHIETISDLEQTLKHERRELERLVSADSGARSVLAEIKPDASELIGHLREARTHLASGAGASYDTSAERVNQIIDDIDGRFALYFELHPEGPPPALSPYLP